MDEEFTLQIYSISEMEFVKEESWKLCVQKPLRWMSGENNKCVSLPLSKEFYINVHHFIQIDLVVNLLYDSQYYSAKS